ncbi:MAG: hypothetical protein QXT96_03665 [Candidatus Bathyarchaeia archaeon]
MFKFGDIVRSISVGKVAKGKLCDVKGCDKPAVRSLERATAAGSGLDLTSQDRVYLCKEHYKVVKKSLKKERLVKKWRYMTSGF